MEGLTSGKEAGSPELFVDRLSLRLKRHSLWDLFLVFFPPLTVLSYLAIYLHRAAWVRQEAIFFTGIALAAVAAILMGLRFFSGKPKAFLAARFIDEKAASKERFLTLTTVSPANCPPFMVDRLRQEAAAFLDRVDLRRDFPYRVKRPFVASLIASLVALLLFHLILFIAAWFAPGMVPTEELLMLNEKLAQVPHLSSLAREIEGLISKMEGAKLSAEEKQSLIQQLQEKVEKQLKAEPQEDPSQQDLLNQMGNALRNLEREGQEEKQEQQAGGGGVTTNLPDEGAGQKEKQSKGSGDGEPRDSRPSQSSDLKGGKSAEGEVKEPGDAPRDEGKGQKTDDKLKDEKQKGKDSEMAKGEQEGKSSKNMSEEIPQGAPPPDRFLKPGEKGEGGVKGARFVTVELPEAEVERSLGGKASGKKKSIQSKLPVSNVPLRQADSPEASAEKQPLPLEYRGLIR